jgi:hypothetical protein
MLLKENYQHSTKNVFLNGTFFYRVTSVNSERVAVRADNSTVIKNLQLRQKEVP